jgi:PAS domain S-box-containing protein
MKLAQLAEWDYDVVTGLFTFSDRSLQLLATTAELEGGRVMSAETFVSRFMHPDDAHLVAESVGASVSAEDPGYVAQVETRVVRRDGVLRHTLVHLSVIKNAAGITILLRGAVQDITSMRESELQLQMLWRAVEQTPAAVLITDCSGEIVYANPQFVSITGYSLQETLGRNPRFLQSGRHSQSFYAQMWGTLLHGEVWRGELQNRRKGGALYWESACIAPVRDSKGRTTHFVGIKDDITERKRIAEALDRAEQKLLESERQRKAILDNITDPAWLRDHGGRFVAVNHAWCEFAGLTAEQALGKTIAELPEVYPAEIAAQLEAEDAWVMTMGRRSQEEVPLPRNGHGTVWFETSKTPLFDETGKPCGLVGIARDVTERKRAAALVLESKHFLQSALNALSAHIAILDQSGTIIAVNTAWNNFAKQSTFLGNNYGVGTNYLSLCESAVSACAGEAPAVAKGIRSVMARECDEFRLEYPCHGPRTAWWFEVHATRFAGDGPLRIVVAHENITGRKRAHEALNEQLVLRERLAKIAANAPGILYAFRLTPDGLTSLPYVSPTMEDFYGVPDKDVMENAAPVFELIHPDDQPRMLDSIAESARMMTPWRVEFRVRHPKKGVFWVEGQSTPELEPDGSILWHGFMSDVTARKQAAEELCLAKEAAEVGNQAKSDFLATVSHEIRTPMNAVLGFTSLLMDTSLSDEQRQFVETIQRSGRSLLALLNDILDFSKIEAGKLKVETIHFNPTEVAGEAVALLSSQARQKGLNFNLRCSPSLPRQLLGDPGRMRQVLVNLAGNAIKYTRHGSVAVELGLDLGGEFVRCEIVDTGIGIPQDKQALLFQKFSQLESSTTRRFGGTGLGLAICKSLIGLMGGQIGLTSKLGQGSTFWFTLPLNRGSDPTAAPIMTDSGPALLPAPRAASRRSETKFRVLLAEDDSTNQILAVHLLKRLSCQVEVAADGAEAVALAGQTTYDLILMDCQMPKMDGFEACREIRRLEQGARRVPIVAATANVLPGQREKCLAAGMDDFLEKPIDAQNLERILSRWTRLAAGYDPLKQPPSPPVGL